MNRIYRNKGTILIFLCVIASLSFLFACTHKAGIGDTVTSIDETKPLSKIDRRLKEERIRIARFSEHVRREGDMLHLKLDSGAEVSFKNLTEFDRVETYAYYEFKEYLADLDLYILDVHFYEGGEYLVISGKSGRNYQMYAYPNVSPDRLHIVAVSEEDGMGGGENSIRLWRIEQGELMEEFYYNTEVLGYYNMNSFSAWQDNKTVRMRRILSAEHITSCPKPSLVEVQVALRKTGGSWELNNEVIEGTTNCSPWN
jgi:hypothetical protein